MRAFVCRFYKDGDESAIAATTADPSGDFWVLWKEEGGLWQGRSHPDEDECDELFVEAAALLDENGWRLSGEPSGQPIPAPRYGIDGRRREADWLRSIGSMIDLDWGFL